MKYLWCWWARNKHSLPEISVCLSVGDSKWGRWFSPGILCPVAGVADRCLKSVNAKPGELQIYIIIPNFNCSKNIFKSFSSSSIQNTKTNMLRICDSTLQSTCQPKKFTLLQLLHYTTVNSNLLYTFSPAHLCGVLMLLAVQCSCRALRRMHTVLGMEYTLSAMWHTILLIMASISSFWPKRHNKKIK